MENSPIKQQAALIRGAGAASKPYVDIMTPMYKGLMGGDSRMALLKYRDKLARQRADELEMQKYVNNYGSFDLSKVEESMRPEVNEFLITQKNDYFEASRIAAKADPMSEEYIRAVQKMNGINSAIKNLSTTLDGFKERRGKYYEDFGNNLISAYSDESRINLNNLYSPHNEYDIEIDENGGVSLLHGEELIDMNKMSGDPRYDYNLINAEGFNELRTLTETAHNLKSVIKDGSYLERNYRYKIDNILDGMSREDLMSIVMDNGMGAGSAIINNPELPDEFVDVLENEPLLRKWLSNHLLGSIKTVAKESEEMYRNDLGDEYDDYYKGKYEDKYKGYTKPPKKETVDRGGGVMVCKYTHSDGTITYAQGACPE